jgi:Uncharacterised protein family (UPF0158)
MEPVTIDWDELELACERNASNIHSYIDLETGAVITFQGESEDEEEYRKNISVQKERYLAVVPASSREQYKWMEKFVGTVTEENLRERLLISIDGKGAFRRFKDLLVHYPGIRERWYTYRGVHLHHHISNWIKDENLNLAAPPPWGWEVVVPDDKPIEPGVITASLSPAEILRRQAKELIDLIPAVDLPSAITFLEYIRDRGSE